MTTNPQIERMDEAIKKNISYTSTYNPNDGRTYITEKFEDAAKAAYDASDARFVPMLVEALKRVDKKAFDYLIGDIDEKEVCRIKTVTEQALAQLPEEYRK